MISVLPIKLAEFLFIGDELYLVCAVFGERELMSVESYSAGFNAGKHVTELCMRAVYASDGISALQ